MKEPKLTAANPYQIKRYLQMAKDELASIAQIVESLPNESKGTWADIVLSSISKAKQHIDLDRELEEIRDLNSALRSWGSHWESEYQKLESQS